MSTFASQTAMFGESEIRFANSPSAVIMPWIVGLKKARELLYTGDLIDADEALRFGVETGAILDATETEAYREFAKVQEREGLAAAIRWRESQFDLERDVGCDVCDLAATDSRVQRRSAQSRGLPRGGLERGADDRGARLRVLGGPASLHSADVRGDGRLEHPPADQLRIDRTRGFDCLCSVPGQLLQHFLVM